jgi:hypothetical protein
MSGSIVFTDVNSIGEYIITFVAPSAVRVYEAVNSNGILVRGVKSYSKTSAKAQQQ